MSIKEIYEIKKLNEGEYAQYISSAIEEKIIKSNIYSEFCNFNKTIEIQDRIKF